MSTGVHFGFMQIKKLPQVYRLDNTAEFVLGPHMNSNQQKNFIG